MIAQLPENMSIPGSAGAAFAEMHAAFLILFTSEVPV